MTILIIAAARTRARFIDAIKAYGHHIVSREATDEAPLAIGPDLIVIEGSQEGPLLETVKALRARPEFQESRVLVCAEGLGRPEAARVMAQGADDCLTLKFLPPVFSARARGLLRRKTSWHAGADAPERPSFGGGLVLSLPERRVLIDGGPAALVPRQFELLAALVKNKNRPVPAKDLLLLLSRSILHPREQHLAKEIAALRGTLGRFGPCLISGEAGSYLMKEPEA